MIYVSVWYEISFFVSLEFASGMIYTLAGIVLIPAVMYFLMSQKNKFTRFCDIYDNPDTQKHPHKIMVRSLFKYLAVIFALTVIVTAPYGAAVLLAPLFVSMLYIALCIRAYIKLWKYHGYSVLLIISLSIITIIVSAALSPFIRAGIWAFFEAFLKISN